MSERDDAATGTTPRQTRPGRDGEEQPWLLTQETPGLDPEPIRAAAGPDWDDRTVSEAAGDGETIDEADVEMGPASGRTRSPGEGSGRG